PGAMRDLGPHPDGLVRASVSRSMLGDETQDHGSSAASDRSSQRSSAARSRASESTIEGVRVLVVDDDPDMREALKTALEAEHARVVAVASAADAIAAIDLERPEVLV